MRQKFYWNEEKVEGLKNIWNTKSLYKITADFHTTEGTIREKTIEMDTKLVKIKDNKKGGFYER